MESVVYRIVTSDGNIHLSRIQRKFCLLRRDKVARQWLLPNRLVRVAQLLSDDESQLRSCCSTFQFLSVEVVKHLDQCRDVQVMTFCKSPLALVEFGVMLPTERDAIEVRGLLIERMWADVAGFNAPRLQAYQAGQATDETLIRFVSDGFVSLVQLAGPDLKGDVHSNSKSRDGSQ